MSYHRLLVYQKSCALALEVHKMSLSFPKIEQYGLGDQLRRSTKSIPGNIAEGMGKQASQAEVVRFMRMAMGSCDENRVWLSFAKDLAYIDEKVYEHYELGYQEVGRMLRGLMQRYVEGKP